MNELMQFEFESQAVRTVILDGYPWFVAKDVCAVLDINNSRDAVARLDGDEKGVVSIDTPGGRQEVQAVNEPGLYSLIVGSRKPEARAFKRWITHDVLPSIRKTGSYVSGVDITKLDPQMQMFHLMFESVAKTQLELADVKQTVQVIQETFLQRDPDWRNSINSLLNAAAFRTGAEYRTLRSDSYRTLEERAHCDLATRLRNLHKRLEESGATKTQIGNTNRMDVIENDARLKEIYTSVVKEQSIASLSVAK